MIGRRGVLVCCLAALLVLTASTPAMAIPQLIIAVGTLLTTLLPALGAPVLLGLTAAELIAGALIYGGLAAATFLLMPGQQQPAAIDPGQLKETFTGAESPEINAIGRVRVGGVLFFGNTNQFDRFRLIGQSKGPIDGIENTYLGGQEVLLFSNGHVASPPYVDSPNLSYIEIHNKDGDGTETAWASLIAAFPSLWTDDHRVRGISQCLVRYESPGFTDPDYVRFYQGGAPNLEQVIRGQKLYDPRTTLTKWSDNGILACLHVLLTWPEFSLADFDLEFVGDEADRADELVEVFGGGSPVPTEKRSRAWGIWSSEMARGEVMAQLLRSVGAEIVPRPNDKIGIALVDDDREPEVTIPLRHIVDLQWRSGPESVERPNLARVKYYSPERGFAMTELLLHEFDEYGAHLGPAWARIQDEIDRYGEKPMDIDLPFCPSPAQAQRLARRIFALARGDVGIATTNLVGLAAWGTRAIEIEFPDDLGTHTVALGPPRVLDDRGQVELPFITWPDLPPWDPAVDEVAAPTQLSDVGQADPLTTPDMPSEAIIVTNGSGTFTRIPGPSTTTGVARTEASYRTFDADGNPNPWQTFGYPTAGAPSAMQVAVDLTGVLADFRIRVFAPEDERGSQWSPILRTTPVVDPTAPGDPSIVATTGTPPFIEVTAPDDLNVAYVVITGGGSPGTVAVVPGQVIGFNGITEPDTWTAQAFATGGAGSGIVSDSLP